MRDIEKLINKAKTELLNKELELLELDEKIKEIFKTKNSIFEEVKDWLIYTVDGITIVYRFQIQDKYNIFITFKINESDNKLMKNIKVKILKIMKL